MEAKMFSKDVGEYHTHPFIGVKQIQNSNINLSNIYWKETKIVKYWKIDKKSPRKNKDCQKLEMEKYKKTYEINRYE